MVFGNLFKSPSSLLPIGIVVVLCVWAYNNAIEQARQEGFDAGVSYQKEVQKGIDSEEEERREYEKEYLVIEYQSRLESMAADLNDSRSTADRLHKELSDIREHFIKDTGIDPGSKTTSQIAGMLTELYSESITEYGKLAEEAEKYRVAGEQCEKQYDSLRLRN